MTVGRGADRRWIRTFHPSPARRGRLICFPHAGGAASYYFPASRALAPQIEVLAVQYPGRQDRRTERCVDNVAGLADQISRALGDATEEPVAFFGHSMGAILAFEVARRMQERTGWTPIRLFVSGRPAPPRSRPDTVHLRDDAGLISELKRLGGVPPQLLEEDDILAMTLPAARNDYKAIETYRYTPGPRLLCPITALLGADDPMVTVDEANAWSEQSAGEFTLRVFPGGHFYLENWPAELLDAIRRSVATPSLPVQPSRRVRT
jgi:pyochelin biosynthesis protein PchC